MRPVSSSRLAAAAILLLACAAGDGYLHGATAFQMRSYATGKQLFQVCSEDRESCYMYVYGVLDMIMLTDDSEQTCTFNADGVAGDNPDDLTHTIPEIVISPDAHPNVGGVPFASEVLLTHSSDLRTMQEVFHVTRPFFLGDAVHANDLSSLFAEGAIPRLERDGDGSCRGERDGRDRKASRDDSELP